MSQSEFISRSDISTELSNPNENREFPITTALLTEKQLTKGIDIRDQANVQETKLYYSKGQSERTRFANAVGHDIEKVIFSITC